MNTVDITLRVFRPRQFFAETMKAESVMDTLAKNTARFVFPFCDQYIRTDDRVREKVWSEARLTELLQAAGFRRIRVLKGGSGGAPGGRTGAGRLYFVCEKD